MGFTRARQGRKCPDGIWEILIGKLPELAPIIERMMRDLESETP
jgi:hypothetical protein